MAGVVAEPGVAKPDPILTVDSLSRAFGGLRAVDVDHLEIQRGTITALIGPNGAGKTSLFNLLTGFDRPDTGTRTFDGRDLDGMAAHDIARLGMVRTFQLTKVLPGMSLLENMRLASPNQIGERFWSALLPPRWRTQEQAVTQQAMALLDRVGMAAKAHDLAGSLSGGQRKLLELARSLMVEPELVMLDEPMAGVNPALTQTLLSHITAIRDAGATIVFVEHDMDVVQTISDWVVVMAEGRVIAEGPPREVAANPLVIDAYLGTHHAEASDG